MSTCFSDADRGLLGKVQHSRPIQLPSLPYNRRFQIFILLQSRFVAFRRHLLKAQRESSPDGPVSTRVLFVKSGVIFDEFDHLERILVLNAFAFGLWCWADYGPRSSWHATIFRLIKYRFLLLSQLNIVLPAGSRF